MKIELLEAVVVHQAVMVAAVVLYPLPQQAYHQLQAMDPWAMSWKSRRILPI